MNSSRSWMLGLVCLGLIACGDDDGVSPVADAGDRDSGTSTSACTRDSDCNDGVFCNGIERCAPANSEADIDGCVAGIAPRCDDGLDCTTDSCSHLVNDCRFVPIDADGDDHAAMTCVTADGESLGDDCDDTDANRYPGNPETCTDATEFHDEDCDPLTVGPRDADSDTFIDAACCNGPLCGDDCDDSERRIGPGYPEICDGLDNNCDARIDQDTILALWYPDDDGDGFGRDVTDPIESCAPVMGRSLFNTDRDDSRASINPAAVEVCDALDNDCDDMIDENDVCVCGVQGAAPCECTSGSLDCLGDLIPRTCVAGHWVTSPSCSGVKPLCLIGRCVCTDGTDSCTAVVDRSPPFIIATAPSTDAIRISTAAVISIVLSEPPAYSTINATNFRLIDGGGNDVDATRTIDGQLVMLTPAQELHPGHFYRVAFQDVTDRAGNVMRNPAAWSFTTAVVDRTRATLCQGAGLEYTLRSLAVGSGGHAAISGECTRTADQVPSQRAAVDRFEAGAWVSTGWLAPPTAIGPAIGVGVDGALAALNLTTGGDVYQLPFGQAVWGEPGTGIGLDAGKALAVAGDRYALVRSSLNNLVIGVGTLGASYTNISTSNLPVNSTLHALATNSRGDVALVLIRNDITLAHWNGTDWLTRVFAPDAATEPHVRINEAGVAIASWLHDEYRQVSDTLVPYDVQHAARFDAVAIDDFVTVEQPIAPANQYGTDVVWLSDGTALLTRAQDKVMAQRMATDGTLAPSVDLEGPIGGYRIGSIDVAALPDGNAIVTWVHGTSAFGPQVIVAARFTNGAWQPVECLVDTMGSSAVQIEALPDGRVMVAWKEGSSGRSMIIE